MSSTDAGTETEESVEAVDEARTALLEAVQLELGEAVAAFELIAGRDLWVRVSTDAWADAADYLRNRQRFRFFDWLSAVDWMPSPFGRSLDAEVDKLGGDGAADDAEEEESPGASASMAGGESRFQVLARVHSLSTGLGITVKTDVPEDTGSVETWTRHYLGAEWHEREAAEMFGLTFEGHPDLRNIYLPTGFEGHPMRKDYPLLSRLVKPWPGIVDVEPMPEVAEPSDDARSGTSEGGEQ